MPVHPLPVTGATANSANSANSRPDFSGLWIPLVTPFAGGDVDHAALKRLVAHYGRQGIAGLVACGSTGEAAALSEAEQLQVLQTVLAAAGPMPVVMGVSGYHLGKMAAWLRELEPWGTAGVLMPAPSYIRPSQAGLIEWFAHLADASPAPVIIYDIPYRTGSTLALETLRTLAVHPRIHAVKDCGGDPAKTSALIADGQLQVLCGEDTNIFSTLAQGGSGAIAAAAHVHTARFAQIVRLVRSGQVEEARALWEPLAPLIESLFAEPNPGPLKSLLAGQGWLADELRSPMTKASVPLAARLAGLHAAMA